MFGYDYSFCDRDDCPRMSCRRHPTHTPKGVPYSISHLFAESDEFELCEWYWKGKDELNKLNKLNLNTATEEDLEELGLGETGIRSILNYRERHGGFTKMEDVLKCRSIGRKTYDMLRGRFYVEV